MSATWANADSGWPTRPLGLILDNLEAGVSVNSVADPGPYGVLKVSCVSEAEFDPFECKTVAPVDLKRARVSPRAGSLIVSRANTLDLVGEVGYVESDYPQLFLSDKLWLASKRSASPVDMRWLAYMLSSAQCRELLREIASGTSGSMKNISRSDFLQISVAFPPVEEQATIADVLGDMSKRIRLLKHLIVKKRAIKQGMMQQLLTAQTRLPGNWKDWSSRPLGSVLGKLEAGVSVKSVTDPGEFFILKTSCVASGEFNPSERKTVAPLELHRIKVSPQSDSLIISRMNTPALVGEVGYVDVDYPSLFLPDRLWLACKRSPNHVNMRWLSYLLSFGWYRERLHEIATGTSGSMKNIARGSLLQLPIPFPSIDEQVAIVHVLSDCDKELTALHTRLQKAQATKQGMMQQLLTGRTRLPV